MALFKISKGLSENLPTTYNEGYAYFTTDDGKFYIDTNNSVDGRIGLNAFKADTDRLGNIIDETYISFEEDEIIEGPVPKIDAETLNGKTADDFILKNDDIAYNKIILPDGSKWDGIITGSGSGGNVNPEEVLKIIKENSAYFDADSDGDVDIILPGGNSNSGSMDMSGYVK